MYYPKDLRKEFPPAFDRAYEQQRKLQKVRDIMSENPVTVSPETTMDKAAKIMGEKHIGSLIVVADGGTPKGIVTERDLFTGVIAVGMDPRKVAASVLMSWPLLTIRLDASIKEAAQTMIKKRGRLAVFDKEKLVGIVTASDLVRTLPNVPETGAKVEEYMTHHPITMDESATVKEAAKLMGAKKIGSVIVTSGGSPKGIFTERDILSKFLAKSKPLTERIGDHDSHPLIVAPIHITVHEAAFIMTSKHIRRLPLTEDEKLAGIVTARDLVEAYAK